MGLNVVATCQNLVSASWKQLQGDAGDHTSEFMVTEVRIVPDYLPGWGLKKVPYLQRCRPKHGGGFMVLDHGVRSDTS